MKRNIVLAAALAVPLLLSACGGGDEQPPAALAATEPGLCPSTLDYSTVYTGGGGDGEAVAGGGAEKRNRCPINATGTASRRAYAGKLGNVEKSTISVQAGM